MITLKMLVPSSSADLMVLRSDLEGRIRNVAGDLGVEMAILHASAGRTVWLAIATLGAVGILLEFF